MGYIDDKRFLKVEDGLFPMCIFSVRTGTKSNWLMTCIKADIEPCDESMNEIVPCSTEFEVCDEG